LFGRGPTAGGCTISAIETRGVNKLEILSLKVFVVSGRGTKDNQKYPYFRGGRLQQKKKALEWDYICSMGGVP